MKEKLTQTILPALAIVIISIVGFVYVFYEEIETKIKNSNTAFSIYNDLDTNLTIEINNKKETIQKAESKTFYINSDKNNIKIFTDNKIYVDKTFSSGKAQEAYIFLLSDDKNKCLVEVDLYDLFFRDIIDYAEENKKIRIDSIQFKKLEIDENYNSYIKYPFIEKSYLFFDEYSGDKLPSSISLADKNEVKGVFVIECNNINTDNVYNTVLDKLY